MKHTRKTITIRSDLHQKLKVKAANEPKLNIQQHGDEAVKRYVGKGGR